VADDPLSRNPPPPVAEIAESLRDVMTRGLRATRADDASLLSSLHAVRRRALVADDAGSLTSALHAEIRDLMRGVHRERLRRLAPYAFGTYTVDELPLAARLNHAQQSGIGWTAQTMRKKPLDELAADMAERLHWLESRLRYNEWLERPFDESLHDQTLRQYDFLTAMAFWLNGAALDIGAALDDRAAGDNEAFVEWGYSALWRWTRFLRVSERFDVEFAGVWALARIDSDERREAMRAAYDAQVLPTLTPSERSLLRVELLSALQEELAPFRAVLERRAPKVVQKWFGWVSGCECLPGQRDDRCEVHRFLDEAATFFELMNKEIDEPHRTDRAARFQTLPDVYEA
jgi:hypothetical protein